MAQNYYSNQDVCIEALFEETNNVCICSRAHLNDYVYSRDYKFNPFDDECGVCYEEVPEDYCEDTSDSCQQALKDLSVDPEMHYDDGLDEEQQLMKSMGLPTSFGKKFDETKNYSGFYSAYNCDNCDEYNYEIEQSDDFEVYDQNGEYFNAKNDDSINLKSYKNIKNISENRSDISKALKYEKKIDFENFWTLHGDIICLNSWVEKYKEHIHPEFLKIFKECGDVRKIINSDFWSANCCKNMEFNHETLPDSCVNDIANPSDNCDSALKTINDKFENMSFSDDVEIVSVDDSNVKCDDTNEKAEPEEIGENLDSYELYSENIMQFNSIDLESSEPQLNFLEKEAECTNISPSALNYLENVSDDKCDLNSNDLASCPNEDSQIDQVYADIKENDPVIVNDLQTQNSLFICTKTNEQYEAEIKYQTWEELWFAHCQDLFSKYSKLFSENPTKLFDEYTEGNISKCKYCAEINCSIHNNECTNPDNDMKVSDLLNKLTSDSLLKNNLSLSGEVLAYPATHSSKEDLDETLLCNVDGQLQKKIICVDDDESPMELPIKRSYEIESENEEPEDMIKDLGLVIRPTKCLKIQNKKRRVRGSQKKDLRTNFQTENIETDNNECEERENNDVDLKVENNEENRSKITEEVHEAVEIKAEENFDENMESEELAPEENTEVFDELNDTPEIFNSYENKEVLHKYWHQRYRLFHKFDEGIKLDEESWFSVTPERIAKHIAERCACGVIVDAFCGAGSNAIQFALVCYHVIAIDKDPKKIELAKHNAAVYGVTDYIDFIVGDYLEIAPYLKADGVFLSPPWGGPSYVNEAEYSIDKIEPDIYKVFEVSRKFTQNIALFVPKNTIVNQLVQLSGAGNNVEIEQNLLNKKVKTITAYYGEFVNQSSLKDESS